MALLHTRALGPTPAPARWLLVLPGILGSGDNWLGFARALLARAPTLGVLLVDLRGHGRSAAGEPPHTVAAAADDVGALLAPLGAGHAVLGHSFGGKVALALGRRPELALADVLVVDTLLGPGGARDRARPAVEVLDALARHPGPQADRAAFGARLREEGLAPAIVDWLLKGLRRTEAGAFEPSAHLPTVRALFDDSLATDAWPWLAPPPPRVRVTCVVGERSEVVLAEDRARLRALASLHAGLVVHELPAAGHWVHVDARDELAALVARTLDRPR